MLRIKKLYAPLAKKLRYAKPAVKTTLEIRAGVWPDYTVTVLFPNALL